jgi:DUF4097 and DUF4098 domain-containing protein YvlB
MTTFPADSPLDVRVRFGAGRLTVTTATDGQATATVEPLDPDDPHALLLAQHARIDLDGDRLTVDAPGKGWRRASLRVHVQLSLPELSSLTSQTGDVVLTTEGELGDVRVRTGHGKVNIAAARGAVDVKAGDTVVVVGSAAAVRVDAGRAHLRVQSAGDVSLKAGHGQAELHSTSGSVVVKGGGVGLDLHETGAGEVDFTTGAGSAHVAVLAGTSVQLDLTSGLGEVRCDLPMESSAPQGGAALRLRLRTGSGDVIVSRAHDGVAVG